MESTSTFTAPTDSWEAEFHDYVARKSTMSGEMDLIAYWKSQPETPLRIVAFQILNVPAPSALWSAFFLCVVTFAHPHEQTWPPLAALVRAKYNIQDDLDEDCMEM